MTVEFITQHNEGGPSGLGWSEMAPLRCSKEYQYGNVRGIYKPTAESPEALAAGSFVHAGRARWFAQKQATDAETWKLMVADVDKAREELPLPTTDAVVRDALRWLQEYVDHWSVRHKPSIVAVEHMLGPVQLRGDATARTARLDDFGFYEQSGGLAIGECKTTTSIQNCITEYTLHGQITMQQLLWRKAPQGEAMYGPVKGVVLDIVEKGYAGKKCNFARVFMPANERVLAWGEEALAAQLEKRAAITWDSEEPRNFHACTRLVGKSRIACPFQNLCMYGRDAATEFALRDGRQLTEHTPEPGKEKMPWE